ncbi:unnamed protein product [Lactuca virosa]|uniref:Uncharacterized protein n=1 Tax=Lactuca virosa TaxID=75947 RepID=A0AAU9M708_9ASTR|nr:unnamed protein product [Lactuca virosa]
MTTALKTTSISTRNHLNLFAIMAIWTTNGPSLTLFPSSLRLSIDLQALTLAIISLPISRFYCWRYCHFHRVN